jgi:hypothetical protein
MRRLAAARAHANKRSDDDKTAFGVTLQITAA